MARITVPVEMVFSQPAHTSVFCAEGCGDVGEDRRREVATVFTGCLRQNSFRRSMVSSPFLRIATCEKVSILLYFYSSWSSRKCYRREGFQLLVYNTHRTAAVSTCSRLTLQVRVCVFKATAKCGGVI